MRIHNIIIAALAAPLLLVGCQKELIVDSGLDKGIHEIAVRTVSGAPVTRSGVSGTTFPAGYDMIVSAYRNNDASIAPDDASANYFTGVKFSKSDAVWHAATPKYWPLTGSLDFLAIAGSGLNTADNGVVPTFTWGEDNSASSVVAVIPDNSAKFDDILFGGSNAQTYMASGNPIVFHHAESAVVFTASSNVAYDESKNIGVTIDGITIDGAKFSGTLTVSNPASAGGTGDITAIWSDLGDQKDEVAARVWNTANLGTDASESVLSALNLTSESATIANKPFGEGYVILPEQDAVPFTITYTIHNGKNAAGEPLNNQLVYEYKPEDGSTWEQGKKHIYDIVFNLNEVTISPSVVDWDNGYSEVKIDTLEDVYPLKFSADGPQTVSMEYLSDMTGVTEYTSPYFEYSYDGNKWFEWDYSPLSFGSGSNHVVYIRGDNPKGINILFPYTDKQVKKQNKNWRGPKFRESLGMHFVFSTDSKVSCEGDVMSLCGIPSVDNCITGDYSALFKNCVQLIEAPTVSSKIISDCDRIIYSIASCAEMFYGCTSLENIDNIDLSMLDYAADCSYAYMFFGCESIKSVTLSCESAETGLIGQWTYEGMFQACHSLESVSLLNIGSINASQGPNYCLIYRFLYAAGNYAENPTLYVLPELVNNEVFDSNTLGSSFTIKAIGAE